MKEQPKPLTIERIGQRVNRTGILDPRLTTPRRTIIGANELTQQKSLSDELSESIGSGFGDWIRTVAKPIATVMGKKGCSTCEARRIVTNAYGKLRKKHGQIVALGLIKDLWALSYKADGEAVLQRLKELLDD